MLYLFWFSFCQKLQRYWVVEEVEVMAAVDAGAVAVATNVAEG